MDIYKNINFTDKQLNKYSSEATDYAYTHGIVMGNPKDKKLRNYAPFTLFPSPIPRDLYEEAWEVQKYFQTLAHKASTDHNFITESLKSCMIRDMFIKRLYEIYDKARKQGIKPRYYFNIMRSDYMINNSVKDVPINKDCKHQFRIQQIELNAIAAAYGGLGTLVSQMHRYMTDVLNKDCPYRKEQLAGNNTLQCLGEGMAKLWQLYDNVNAVLLFVVTKDGIPNTDQRHLEYSFQESVKKHSEHFVPVMYRSLKQVYQNGNIEDGKLFVDGCEVALCYIRSGFNPNNYLDEEYWKGRELIELSTVPKCPTIAEQLIGSKKIQQVFASPGMVEKYIVDGNAVEKIRRTFAGLYSLDPGTEGDEAVKMAIRSPSNYILKPQREGGGNNLYDEEMVKELQRIHDPLERSQYILMERIHPPLIKNYIVHIDFEKPTRCDTLPELGIFGIFISDGNKVIFNDAVGPLLRTKDVQHKDGGVSAGRAVLDSPYLV